MCVTPETAFGGAHLTKQEDVGDMKKRVGAFAVALVAVALAAPMFANTNTQKTLDDRVRHELVMLPYFSIFDDLSFRLDGSTVVLSGDVHTPAMRSDAESAVKHVEGVTRVVNNINVLPLSPFDNRIRLAEYRAVFGYSTLYRYAEGPNPSIRIIVDGGRVKLVGVVDSQTDKNIAGIRASGVPGVFSVENDLVVAG